MPKITSEQFKKFEWIRDAFPLPALPSQTAWRSFSNDRVWMHVLRQVVVVGNAAPGQKLWSPTVRKGIKWSKLRGLSEREAKRAIWGALNEVGARYRGRTFKTCRKTNALSKNLEFLRKYPDGPKGFLRTIATLEGSSSDKVVFVARHLSYIKNKGARDLLTTGFGLTNHHIALDARVLAVLRQMGIGIPRDVQSNRNAYEALSEC